MKLHLCVAVLLGVAAADDERPRIIPGFQSARRNAFHIFNALQSAGRQWGSSRHHNGFGYVPSIVPAGTVLYHGSMNKTGPSGPEWLSFEAEHAYNFGWRYESQTTVTKGYTDAQAPLDPVELEEDACPNDDPYTARKRIGGYFHTYSATRDLNLLLLDGMSAGSSSRGSMDLWNTLLLGTKSSEWEEGGERVGISAIPMHLQQAIDACSSVIDLGYDGFIRMEMGFEVVYCNFSDGGLEHTFAKHQVPLNEHLTQPTMNSYLWARAVSQRYDGVGGGRLRMDFSSMISGLFFDFDTSSPTPGEPHRIRLKAAGMDNLKQLKAYLRYVLHEPGLFTLDWQGLTDMIVARFADRLAAMALPDLPAKVFIQEVEALTMQYLAADDGDSKETNRTADAIEHCKKSYLLPALASYNRWSLADTMIHSSVATVIDRICADFFTMQNLLAEASHSEDRKTLCSKNQPAVNSTLAAAVEECRGLVRSLMELLDWTDWQRKRRCAADKILFTPMFPLGSVDDYFDPGCRPPTYFGELSPGDYWDWDSAQNVDGDKGN